MPGTVLLKEVEATGAGGGLLINGKSEHTVEVIFTNSGGSVTALTVDLEGSIDGGTNWYTLKSYPFSAAELVAKKTAFSVVDRRFEWVRANITTLTETGTTKVTVTYY